MFNTLTKALHVTVSILQVISSIFVFNKPLEIPSYIPLFSQCHTVGEGPGGTLDALTFTGGTWYNLLRVTSPAPGGFSCTDS